MTALLGVDIGGTTTKVLLIQDTGTTLVGLKRESWPTPRDARALADFADTLAGWVGSIRPEHVGVSTPGVLSVDGRSLVVSANLPGLVGLPLAEVLAAPYQATGDVLNDGAAAAGAEARLGAARGEPDALVIALGTGVAGAHVLHGQVRRGAHGAAGEIGHVTVDTGRECPCGLVGCLETSIGGVHLAARWNEATGREGCTALDVVEAARDGDARAVSLLDKATGDLATALLNAVALLDPGVIVIGGGLAQAVDMVVTPTARKLLAAATFHHVPPVVAATLGPWAGAWGAALTGIHRSDVAI